MTNTISILGSTGSIGRQTLDVAEQLGLRAAALTADTNVERMEAQCRKFRPKLAVMTNEAAAKELAIRLQDTSVKVLAGTDALAEAAVLPEADTVVTAVVGMVGLINYPRKHDPTRVQLGFHTLHLAFQPGGCTSCHRYADPSGGRAGNPADRGRSQRYRSVQAGRYSSEIKARYERCICQRYDECDHQ